MDDSRNVDAAIAHYGLRERVIITGHVPDDQLVAFYQSGTFFAFPSLNEGFGIPVVESFAADLPLMASRSASLPEVAGDAALFFDASSVEDIERAIVTMATDENIRLQLKVKGRQRLKHFSWEKTARELVSLFEVIHPPPP
jgi:glycosyltransferase involved in cell wall biosynthesis